MKRIRYTNHLLKRTIEDLIINRRYIYVTALLFICAIWIGTKNPQVLTSVFNQQIEQISDLGEWIENQNHSQLWLFIIIFMNNFLKSIIFMYTGILFAILPFIMLITNGMLLGFVLNMVEDRNVFEVFMKGILPHGIIEIPAILISCAYGIKLGILSIKSILHSMFPSIFQNAFLQWKQTIKNTGMIVGFLFICFFIAASIESTITLWLVNIK